MFVSIITTQYRNQFEQNLPIKRCDISEEDYMLNFLEEIFVIIFEKTPSWKKKTDLFDPFQKTVSRKGKKLLLKVIS